MMGLASCRTTFLAQNVIMVTSTKLQKFRIQYLLGLESRSSIPLQKRNKHNHKGCNNYLQTKGRTFTKIIIIVQKLFIH